MKPVLDLSKLVVGASRVIGRSSCHTRFMIMCGCGRQATLTRDQVRKSRYPGRNLHCYECSCKARAEVARAAAIGRKRAGGKFTKV